MLDPEQFERAQAHLGVLAQAEPELKREFQQAAYMARIPVGRDVFLEGDRVDAIPLLLSGTVRVYQVSASGREVTLYRFQPGESCVLTANAILSHQDFPAIASVEREAEAVMVPSDTFRAWVHDHELWREFYFDLIANRLASVMALVDEVAFQRMDRRIASLLLSRAQEQDPIMITHQEIADELGSSREVISRILEDLAGRGLLRTERGAVHIVDPAALEQIAAS